MLYLSLCLLFWKLNYNITESCCWLAALSWRNLVVSMEWYCFYLFEQVLNAEEEIRRRSILASLRAAMPQPSENVTDGSSVSRLGPRMTVDVNFGDVAGDSDAGSNQGTPGRPLHHFHSISPSTASFARSPFGSLQVSCSNGYWIVLKSISTFGQCHMLLPLSV